LLSLLFLYEAPMMRQLEWLLFLAFLIGFAAMSRFMLNGDR
jgi:hypothetical protein